VIIYCAAVENNDVKHALKNDAIRHGFSSYFYLRKLPKTLPADIRQHTKRHVVDSGAHSFFASIGISAGKRVTTNAAKGENPDAFWAAYFGWLKANVDSFDHFVELDIGEIVGQDKVRAWRGQIRKAGLAEKCIIAYHPAMNTLREFIAEADNWPSRYVGIEGLRLGTNYPMKEAVRACYDIGVGPHGFAMMKQKYMNAIPFFSVDSASYKASVLYGAAVVMDGGKLSYMRPTSTTSARSRARHARLSVNSGLPLSFRQSVRGTYRQDGGKAIGEVLSVSARAVQQAEDYYTRLWEARGIRWDERIEAARKRRSGRSGRSRSLKSRAS
jgi:hypothetical protein